MDINVHDVVVRPRITSKAHRLNSTLKKLVLEVHPHATKPMVIRALKALFNIEVERIGMVTVHGKRRQAGRHTVQGKKKKKAIITLKTGSTANVYDWSSLQQAQAPQE